VSYNLLVVVIGCSLAIPLLRYIVFVVTLLSSTVFVVTLLCCTVIVVTLWLLS